MFFKDFWGLVVEWWRVGGYQFGCEKVPVLQFDWFWRSGGKLRVGEFEEFGGNWDVGGIGRKWWNGVLR